MATQIKSIVRFVNVPSLGMISLPHGLKISPPAGGELPQTPDHVTPSPSSGFTVTADDLNVTVTNNGPDPASVDVLCEYWHTIERAFGDVAVLQLDPRPFIEEGGAGGGSGCCLTDDPPSQIDIGDADQVGIAPDSARADHQHAFPAPPAPPTVTGAVNGAGVATTAARADHQHRLGLLVDDEGVPVTVPGVGVPELNFLGAGVTAALVGDRVDVTIPGAAPHDCEDCLATGAEPPTQIDIGDAQVVGVVPLAARADHQHAFPAPPSPPTATGAVNGAGVATTAARADHQHRLGLLVDDEGVVVGPGRPEINFIGMGVGAVDNPGLDRVDVTIPGANSDGAVVKRSLYKSDTVSTSSGSYVDAMSGGSVVVPIDGDYLAIFEGETFNSNANAIMQVGVSVNSVVAVVAGSERRAQGNASDYRTTVTSVQLLGLVAGDLVRALFEKLSGAGSVTLVRRHLIIMKVQ